MHPEIVDQQDRLKRLFEYADNLQENAEIDTEIKAHFAQYLCVQTSGFIETSVKTILQEYVRSKTEDQPTLNLVDARMKRTLNPGRSTLLPLIGEFSKDWSDLIRVGLRNELGTSLDSVVSIRNQVAHGEDVTLTLHDMQRYFDHAQMVVRLIYEQCNSLEMATAK